MTDPYLAMARAFIEKQVASIKQGDVEALAEGVTDRVKSRISAAGVESAAKQLERMTIEDLVDRVEIRSDGLKLYMKNGRTLTTLVRDGESLKADTVWFK